MTLQLGDTAPDFEAETTRGPIGFHEWLGGSRGLLFSHPADFAPVCTTGLGAVARLKGEFDRRGTKVMGLPVDPVESHLRWEGDIGETQGAPVSFPMIADADREVPARYGCARTARSWPSSRPSCRQPYGFTASGPWRRRRCAGVGAAPTELAHPGPARHSPRPGG